MILLHLLIYYYYNVLYIDYNECLVNNGGCSQICNNNNGSYYCSCYSGYELNNGDQCFGK